MSENTCDELNEYSLDSHCDELRYILKGFARKVMNAKKHHTRTTVGEKEDRGEVMANIMLSYRHIEDAAMRLGKVKQHLNDGESVYDKNVVGDPRD